MNILLSVLIEKRSFELQFSKMLPSFQIPFFSLAVYITPRKNPKSHVQLLAYSIFFKQDFIYVFVCVFGEYVNEGGSERIPSRLCVTCGAQRGLIP